MEYIESKDKAAVYEHRRSLLFLYDLGVLLIAWTVCMVLVTPTREYGLTFLSAIEHYLIMTASLLLVRAIGGAYRQIWRYSRHRSYLRLIVCDIAAGAIYYLVALIAKFILPGFTHIWIFHTAMILMVNLLGSLVIRFCYTWLYELGGQGYIRNPRMLKALTFFTGVNFNERRGISDTNKIRIAIIGAGRVGVSLAEELFTNPTAAYLPVCFVDVNSAKIGRRIMELPVLEENDATMRALTNRDVQEIVIAVTDSGERQKDLYNRYKDMGFKVKVYSFSVEDNEERGKRQIREFDIQELLFREEKEYLTKETKAYYYDKVVLVSGGGGSIGSELARQIAKMKPRQLILLDIYENNLYDVQQEMRMQYGPNLNLAVEVASVRDLKQLNKVFSIYRPEVVLHAAAHKHVPLMEHNCSEAVKNNVFGTYNMVTVAKKYGVRKFVMVSTDKAVNPTNVMGATKRMCEMIVLSNAASRDKTEGNNTSFSCTRFGNVLGSNGSVIPLFKRQIAKGGPITLTDKRIIRYFMTIPEASQLVLTSGAMAHNGELFVLDMGRPVKILDLAENMIKLSGLRPYEDIDIIETGLRPGEKLYEELLIKSKTLTKTDNSMIFIEKDQPISEAEVQEKLEILKAALATEDDDKIRKAVKNVVPTFHSAKHVNRNAEEMIRAQTGE